MIMIILRTEIFKLDINMILTDILKMDTKKRRQESKFEQEELTFEFTAYADSNQHIGKQESLTTITAHHDIEEDILMSRGDIYSKISHVNLNEGDESDQNISF